MKYDPQNPPKYLRQTTTGRIYPFSIYKVNRADMEAYEMPAKAATTVEVVPVMTAAILDAVADAPDLAELEARVDAIKSAIAQIPVESYGKAVGGKPALPKVGEVSALTGFKVTAAEILEIVKG